MLARMLEAMGLNSQKAHLRRWTETARRIGAREAELAALDDEALRSRALALVERLRAAAPKAPGRRDEGMEECFAIAREASRRVLGMRHFDVQLIGAMALREGKLAEMKTGEGKSLCLTLAAIDSAARGEQAHVVTVNEYLARRDAEAMAPLYGFFGLQVGLLADGQELAERRDQYAKDIVYGVNHEFGFDYLRHNMASSDAERRMVRGLRFAIVDEVDSILIDEARTPLIISGQENDDLSVYASCWEAALLVDPRAGDAQVDEKMRTVSISEEGFDKIESFFMERGLIESPNELYDPARGHLTRALQACLQARFLYRRDQHYIVADGKVQIVDENTGRLMADRRWSNGIHQAMEAKEGVEVLQESKTLATITYQNFFRLYDRLSGLTGTAMTQEGEFASIYGLEAVPIPTHRQMIRVDRPDVVYRTQKEKFQALAQAAKEAVASGRPVLAGTSNIEESERLSRELERLGVPHQLLNAKNHALEAQIIEEAGMPGRVTVATNMAGRGTDIVLGGNWGAIERAMREAGASEEEIEARRQAWKADRQTALDAGGLLVLGCARNDSRRVDNQLRGRSGRQGDPGESRFMISLEDSLFRVYAQSGFLRMIDKYGMMPEGSSLEHPMLSKSFERAQAAVEGHHFDMRKQLQEFDGVGASQRKIVYNWRDEIIDAQGEEAWDMARAAIEGALDEASAHFDAEGFVESWASEPARQALSLVAPLPPEFDRWLEEADEGSQVRDKLLASWLAELDEAKALPWATAEIPKAIILERIDDAWQEHLTSLQSLMDGIHLRSYAQKDPKQEFKREGYEMFGRLRGAVLGQAAGALLGWARWAKQASAEAAAALERAESSPDALFPPRGEAVATHWLDAAESEPRWEDLVVRTGAEVWAIQAKAPLGEPDQGPAAGPQADGEQPAG